MKHQDQPRQRGKVRWRCRAEALLREGEGEPFTARQFGERWGISSQRAGQVLSTLRRRGDLYIARRVSVQTRLGPRTINFYGYVQKGK